MLPIRFPADEDVSRKKSLAFRVLPSDQLLAVLRGILDAGWLMFGNSPRLDFARQHAVEQERAAQRAIREFVARHGH